MRFSAPTLTLSALVLVTLLGGCEIAPKPDYRIKVMPAPDGHGFVAIPPECLSWYEYGTGGPSENMPWPSYGCAEAKNLAAMVDRPEDLIEGKPLGPADPVVSAAAISRYQAGKTTPLIDPNADAPQQVIKMEDARIGGGAVK